MSQGALYPNLSQKVQKEVSQMANHNCKLNHLKTLYIVLTFKWSRLDTNL